MLPEKSKFKGYSCLKMYKIRRFICIGCRGYVEKRCRKNKAKYCTFACYQENRVLIAFREIHA